MGKKLNKRDILLKIIDYYEEVSPYGLNLLSTDTYFKKAQSELVKNDYITKSDLNITKNTSKEYKTKLEKKKNTYKEKTYHLTPKGKKLLYEMFPLEYGEYESPKVRKNNNTKTVNLAKNSNIEITALSIGAAKINDIIEIKEDINNDYSAAELELEIEMKKQNSVATSAANSAAEDDVNISFLSDFLDDDYNSFSQGKNNISVSAAEAKTIKEKINKTGVYIPLAEIRKNTRLLSKEDVNHNNYVALSAILLTEKKMFSLYNAIDGYLPLTRRGEINKITQIASHLASKYGISSQAIEEADMRPNGIIICETKRCLENLYLNKYNAKTEFQNTFVNANVITMDEKGQKSLQRLLYCQDYEKKVIDAFVDIYDYKERTGQYRYLFPLENGFGQKIYLGFNFSVSSFMEIVEKKKNETSSFDFDNFELMCFDWQEEIYKNILAHYGFENVYIQTIKEENIDKIAEFKEREKITGEALIEMCGLGKYQKLKKKEIIELF